MFLDASLSCYKSFMESSRSFKVDLADPQSLPEKLSEAEEKLAGMEAALTEQVGEVMRWRQLVATLRQLAGAVGASAAELGDQAQHLTELQARVAGVVNREVRKIRAREVTDALNAEGIEVSNESVSNCLWHLAEKVQPSPIQRVGRGFYAPHAYREVELSPGEAAGSLLAGAGLAAVAAGAAHGLLRGSGG
jgi:hypothetical protein